jgi:hypothetical protein
MVLVACNSIELIRFSNRQSEYNDISLFTTALLLYTQPMKIPTTITLEPAVRAALELAAVSQQRTRSWIANQALARELLVDHQPSVPAKLQQEHSSQ